MKKLIILMFLLLFIASCTASHEQEAEARNWCQQFGGLQAATHDPLGGLRARCNNGFLIINDFTSTLSRK